MRTIKRGEVWLYLETPGVWGGPPGKQAVTREGEPAPTVEWVSAPRVPLPASTPPVPHAGAPGPRPAQRRRRSHCRSSPSSTWVLVEGSSHSGHPWKTPSESPLNYQWGQITRGGSRCELRHDSVHLRSSKRVKFVRLPVYSVPDTMCA